MGRTTWLLAVVLGAARIAEAQTADRGAALVLTGTAGAAWDDETHLGRGVGVAVGAAVPLGSRAAVEAVVDWSRVARDSGYLAAHTTPVAVLVRAVASTGGGGIRAFGSAGIGVLHLRGRLVTKSTVLDPEGRPTPGPDLRTPFSATRPAWEAGGGIVVPLGLRLAIRPEARWLASIGSGETRGVEPPFWLVRGGVSLVWSLR